MLSSTVAATASPSPSRVPRLPRLPRLRRGAASASLAAAAAGFAWSAVSEGDFLYLRWELAGMAALTATASLGLLRRGVLAQVLSRGVAWLVCMPAMAGLLGDALQGHGPDAAVAGFAASTGLSLLLSWPNLHTPQARGEFSPVAYRRTFLAGAVASATGGTLAALGALGNLIWGSRGQGVELAMLAAVMLATTLGVVRMRAWGVLLGLATAVAMLGEALAHRNDFMVWGYALAAVPGLLLAVPLLVSRLRTQPPGPQENASAVLRTSRSPEVRVRVADAPAPASADDAEPSWANVPGEPLARRAP